MVLIRRERPDDHPAVDEVHRRAFAATAPSAERDPVEVALVRALRADAGWLAPLSMVAEDDRGRVIGHVVGSEGAIGDTAAVGLGPLGVLPEEQGRHVGHALMHAVLGAADALGYPVVVLLGHTGFYPRFGFVPASTLSIEAPDARWGEHFQARPLAAYRREVRGRFRYAAPFQSL